MAEAFLILDVADSLNWHSGPPADSLCRIPPEKRPTVLQATRAVAEAEILRLQKAHPEGRFVLFTATHVTTLVEAPTHVTLSGKTLFSEKIARLAQVEEGIPF